MYASFNACTGDPIKMYFNMITSLLSYNWWPSGVPDFEYAIRNWSTARIELCASHLRENLPVIIELIDQLEGDWLRSIVLPRSRLTSLHLSSACADVH